MDIFQGADPTDIGQYRKTAAAIKELKLEWSKRVQEQQLETFTEKEKKNLKYDSDKYKQLEELGNSRVFPGPLVTDDEVRQYISLDLDDDIKNKRLYKEVRYA